MIPAVSVLVGVVMMALAPHWSLEQQQQRLLFVVFGRPGSGKSTIADSAASLLTDEGRPIIRLDLDVCVPQWMKDNFSNGIYPDLSQREAFAMDACNYVDREMNDGAVAASTDATTIVSFSFVNRDLRTIFRKRFPQAEWLLIDTSDAEANNRIKQRTGHFYKGKIASGEKLSEPERKIDAGENSEWAFADVDFPHTIVDGMLPIESNARLVADIVKEKFH